jgi:hypothetical protein
MNKSVAVDKSSAIGGTGGIGRIDAAQKAKTTGGASPVVLEVYHEVEAGLLVRSAAAHHLAGFPTTVYT